MNHFLIFAALTSMSAILVHGIRCWTQRLQILDVPNHRSSHSRPTPRGGGLAIVAICLFGLVGYQFLRQAFSWSVVVSYCAGAALIAAVSWMDDLRSLSSRIRFLAQSLGAILIVLGCAYWNHVTVPVAGDLQLGWIGIAITLMWIVGLTNSYNFMDGIDGIAGIQAVIAGLGWFYIGTAADHTLVSTLGLLVAASSLGFLVHNRPPARIFMGDVGSAFLGYTLAAMTVLAGQTDSRLSVAGVLLVWPFVFDAVLTFLHRLHKRENVFSAHRSHLYQRLVIAGWTHGSVTLLYAGLSLVGLLLAVILITQPGVGDWLVVVAIPSMAVGLCVLVHYEQGRLPASEDRSGRAVDEGPMVRDGRHLTLISTESMLIATLAAADNLTEEGFWPRVLRVPSGKPLDTDAVLAAAHDTGLIVTIERNSAADTSGDAVRELLLEFGIPDVRCYQIRLSPSSDEVVHDKDRFHAVLNLDADKVTDRLREILKHDFHADHKVRQDGSIEDGKQASQAIIASSTARVEE